MFTEQQVKQALEAPLEESIQLQWRLHVKGVNPLSNPDMINMPRSRNDLKVFYTSIWQEYRALSDGDKQSYVSKRTFNLNRIFKKIDQI